MKNLIFKPLRRIASCLMRTPLARSTLAGAAYKRLYRALGPKQITAIDVQGSRMFLDPRDEGIAMFLLTGGVFEPAETKLVRELLRPGMVVADVGANIGYYTLLSARLVGSGGRVYAFEPDPKNHALLARSVEANGYAHVEAAHMALSDRKGTIRLFVDGSNYGNASIAEANVPDEQGAVEVGTSTLDEFLASGDHPRPDFIKMDAQGAEALILAGADRTFSAGPMKMLLEFWPFGLRNAGSDPQTYVRRLADYGFAFTRIGADGSRRPITDPPSLVAECESRARGTGFVNLLLEK